MARSNGILRLHQPLSALRCSCPSGRHKIEGARIADFRRIAKKSYEIDERPPPPPSAKLDVRSPRYQYYRMSGSGLWTRRASNPRVRRAAALSQFGVRRIRRRRRCRGARCDTSRPTEEMLPSAVARPRSQPQPRNADPDCVGRAPCRNVRPRAGTRARRARANELLRTRAARKARRPSRHKLPQPGALRVHTAIG